MSSNFPKISDEAEKPEETQNDEPNETQEDDQIVSENVEAKNSVKSIFQNPQTLTAPGKK